MARPRFHGFGFLAALLALAGQLTFGALLPQPVLSNIASGRLCQAGASGSAPVHPEHHVPLKAVNPLCVALIVPTPPLAAAPPVPVPTTLRYFIHISLRAVTAAPPVAPRAAPPRGPPFLV